jgi:hypothetical protein
MGPWNRFRRLSGSERRIVVEAIAAIAATRVGLRIAGFQRWRSLLDRFSRIDRAGSGEFSCGIFSSSGFSSEISRLTFSTANSLFFHSSCLERSLALWWMLRRRGVDARLQLGARKDGPQFEAHAWVEVAGAVLGDSSGERERFVRFGEMSDSMSALAEETR